MGQKTHPTLSCLYIVFVLWDYFAGKHMTLGNNLKELQRAMTGIGKTDSEERGDPNLFSIQQAKAIIDYLVIRYLFLRNLFLFR